MGFARSVAGMDIKRKTMGTPGTTFLQIDGGREVGNRHQLFWLRFNFINYYTSIQNKHSYVIFDCKVKLLCFEETRLMFVHREADVVADCLAEKAKETVKRK